MANATTTAVQVKGSKTWYHLNHCTRVPTERRIQPYRDEDPEDADTPDRGPNGAGAAEEIKAPEGGQEANRPSGSQDTTNTPPTALRRSKRRDRAGEETGEPPLFNPVGPETPGWGENDMPDIPGDIPTVADIPGGSPIQWDPEVHPREWEHLFPGIDAFPDRSPNGSEEGAPQTEEGGATVGEATPTGATEGEATQAGGGEATPAAGGEISQRGEEGNAPRAEGQGDFPSIDFSALAWSPR